jgi:hypothetical protein
MEEKNFDRNFIRHCRFVGGKASAGLAGNSAKA